MTALKTIATAAVLAAPVLIATAPAEATTARQYTFQGQGLYTTSKGLPENFIGGSAAPQEGISDRQPKDLEHHGRYFGGN